MRRIQDISSHFVVIGLLTATLAMTGCGNFMYKQYSTVRGEIIRKGDVDCSAPYELSLGCSSAKLASIPLNLHGLEFVVSATEDGSTTLVMHRKVTGGTTVLSNLMFEAVRTEYSKSGLTSSDIIAVETRYYEGADVVIGYFITVDGNGFELLRQYEVRAN